MAPAGPLILLLLMAIACREEERTPGPPPSVPVPPTLSGRGVGCLTIGAPLAGLAPECRIVADRVVPGPEGMRERQVAVVVGADTVTATIVADSVWRLDVTTPAIRTEHGFGAGMAAADLIARSGSRVIGGEGRLFITLADQCGLSFELGPVPRELLALPPARAAERIPTGTRISRVLVFGCQGRT